MRLGVFILAGWMGLLPLDAGAGTVTFTTTSAQDAKLLQMTQQENQERVDRGEPLTRFCVDAPVTCAQPDVNEFVRWVVGTRVQSLIAQENDQTSQRIRRFCFQNPDDTACTDLRSRVP